MNDPIVILCTCPDTASAGQLAKKLVSEKLAACVNVLPQVTSYYVWDGQQEEGQEVQLIIKSRRTLYGVLQQRIQELHPYDVPEIIALPIVAGLPTYLQWVQEQTDL